MPRGAGIDPIFALSLAASLVLSGCATSLPPNPSDATVRGQVPAKGLPRVSRIVASEQPISLVGFWNDPKEREEFEKRRAEIIAKRVEANKTSGAGTAGEIAGSVLNLCLVYGSLCVFALPVLPVAAAVAVTVDNSRARNVASRGVEYIPISESNSRRLAALYSETLTGVALGERTLRLVRSGPAPVDEAAEYPLLAVAMKSATARMEEREGLRVKVVAEAQAQPAPGVAWAPTIHVIDMELWQRYDYTVAVQKILDVLSQSIVATYLPQHPFSVEHRLWNDVRAKDAPQVQVYLDRYPAGTYAEAARARLAELAAADAAARKRAAQAAAAERAAADAVVGEAAARAVFVQRARVHPALEGSWSGSAPVPFCSATSYALRIENGNVEGTVEWRLSAVVKERVLGYVKDDGTVFVVPVASGHIDSSRTLNLSLDASRLSGFSTITCASQRHLVSLQRG